MGQMDVSSDVDFITVPLYPDSPLPAGGRSTLLMADTDGGGSGSVPRHVPQQ